MLRAASASPSSARRAFLGVRRGSAQRYLLECGCWDGRCVRLPTPARILEGRSRRVRRLLDDPDG
eukprot:7087694-Prymnesium_polylepis.1